MNMHELGHRRLIGTARTDIEFPLIIATRWNLPFLLYAPGHGQVEFPFYHPFVLVPFSMSCLCMFVL